MPTTKLTNTLTATTLEPRDTLASLEELSQFGFLPSEVDSDFKAKYETVFNRSSERASFQSPSFRVGEDAAVETPAETATAAARFNSTRKCGGVLRAPGITPFTFAMGRWVVPLVRLVEPGHWHLCASWVGIDGFTTPTRPLIRLGVVSWTDPPTTIRQGYFFFQWGETEDPIVLEGVGCVPGDIVVALLWVGPVGSRLASVAVLNETRGVGTQVMFSTTEGGGGVGGQTAAWMMSDFPHNPSFVFGNYREVLFNNCYAWNSVDHWQEGGTGTARDYVVGGSLIEDGTIISPTEIRCRYIG